MARKPPKLTMIKPLLKTVNFRTCRPPPKKADDFYSSPAWRNLRASIFRDRGAACQKCGAQGGRIYADHIRELRDGGEPLDPSNVMLLCAPCHTAKTAKARAVRLGLV